MQIYGTQEVRVHILGPVDWLLLRESLRRARDQEGLTLDELAAQSGIDRSTIHRIENVKKRIDHNPDLETIEALVVRGMGRTLSSFFAQIETPESAQLPPTFAQEHNSGRIPQGEGRHAPVVSTASDAELERIGLAIGRGLRTGIDRAARQPAARRRDRGAVARAKNRKDR